MPPKKDKGQVTEAQAPAIAVRSNPSLKQPGEVKKIVTKMPNGTVREDN